MADRRKQITGEREALFYIGMAMMAIGALSFVSSFLHSAMTFGDFSNFEATARQQTMLAFGGLALFWVGLLLRHIGAKGWAGSGIVLDPEQARQDVEPWSRMGGGIVKDALEEVDVVNRLVEGVEARTPVIKLRCRACQALNDDGARFCDQCGAVL